MAAARLGPDFEALLQSLCQNSEIKKGFPHLSGPISVRLNTLHSSARLDAESNTWDVLDTSNSFLSEDDVLAMTIGGMS